MIDPNKQLRRIRLDRGLTAAKVAEDLKITAQHLSRIENGRQAPSRLLLEQMVDLYRMPSEDAENLRQGFGFPTQMSPQRNVSMPADSNLIESGSAAPLMIKVDAMQTPVYFSNAMAISSDEHGIVLDAGQKVVNSNEIQIVARIGLNLEHARHVHEQLGTHIKKLDRGKSLEG